MNSSYISIIFCHKFSQRCLKIIIELERLDYYTCCVKKNYNLTINYNF